MYEPINVKLKNIDPETIEYDLFNLRLIGKRNAEDGSIIYTFESNKSGAAWVDFDYTDDGKQKKARFEINITDEEAPRENAPQIAIDGDTFKMYEPINVKLKNIDPETIEYDLFNLRLIGKRNAEDGSIIYTFESNKSGAAWVDFDYTDDGKQKKAQFEINITDEKYQDNDTTKDVLKGDANCDGTVDMGDVVLIMQALANPNKYGVNGSNELHITLQGIENGDVDAGVKGLTVSDALKIQRYLLGDEKSL